MTSCIQSLSKLTFKDFVEHATKHHKLNKEELAIFTLGLLCQDSHNLIRSDQVVSLPKVDTGYNKKWLSQVQRITAPGKTRRRISQRQKTILLDWYRDHISSPFPCKTTKEHLANECQLSMIQIETWFTNARRRGVDDLPAFR